MSSLGETLREAREAHGLSLSDVEGTTKIRRKYLLAIESDRPEEFPAPVYARGCVRTYASALGLDPNQMVSLYDSTRPKEIVGVQAESRPPRMPGALTGRVVFGLFVIAALSSGGYYLFEQYRLFLLGKPTAVTTASVADTPTAVAVAYTPVATAVAAPPPASPSPTFAPSPTPTVVKGVQVRAKIKDRSWLRVTVDGQVKFEGIPQVGDELVWDGLDTIVMRTGNAAGVEVTFNGKPEGTLGAPGEVKDVKWTGLQ